MTEIMKCLKLLLFTVVGFVVQCAAMSVSELEDFANFLRKTSQLDETLKKGADPSDFDEDDTISDHAWEESGKFEGDLILNERQRRMIVEDIAEGLSRNGLRDSTKRWPDNEVTYYIQKEHFSEDQIQAIQNGIDDLARASCVKFKPYRKGDRDAVVIQGSRRGCFSQVGYQGGYQVLNLSGRHPVGRGCFRHGTVVHELLHTLGFYHMQSSPDRDEFVDVIWENIVQPARHNFRKYNAFAVSDFGVGYDYDSVLHYSRRAFSSNGQDTIVPKQSGAQIGQRVGLSDKDVQKLNKMYCDADSSNDQGEEVSIQKPPNKKKTQKNKPFEGHGIGYHQGKTVVIKLLPTAETYQILNKPVLPMFDSFSKTPENLPTKKSEDFGYGKQVTDSYKPFNAKDIYNQAKTEIHKLNGIKPESNLIDIGILQSNDKVDNQNQTIEIPKNTSVVKDNTENLSSEIIDDELRAAIIRLAKLLKTHVYPSNTPDLKIYGGDNTDYSEYANPNKLPKIAQDYNPPSESKERNNDTGSSAEYIKSLYNDGPSTINSEKKLKNYEKLDVSKNTYEILSPANEKVIPKEEEALYRTTYPFKLHQHISNGSIEIKTPEYAAYENIKDKNDYSKLYSPYAKSDDDEIDKRHHKILGEYAPVYDDWYTQDEHRRHPIDYDRESFTHDSPEKSAYRAYDASESSEYEPESENEYYTGSYSPQKKQAYSLFGAPVPLTKDWYRVDNKKLTNYPYKYSLTPGENLETNDSQEVKR